MCPSSSSRLYFRAVELFVGASAAADRALLLALSDFAKGLS